MLRLIMLELIQLPYFFAVQSNHQRALSLQNSMIWDLYCASWIPFWLFLAMLLSSIEFGWVSLVDPPTAQNVRRTNDTLCKYSDFKQLRCYIFKLMYAFSLFQIWMLKERKRE